MKKFGLLLTILLVVGLAGCGKSDNKTETKKENYNVQDIFKNKKENQQHTIIQNENSMETSIIEYKKENIFKKILNKIVSFFGSKKKGDKI